MQWPTAVVELRGSAGDVEKWRDDLATARTALATEAGIAEERLRVVKRLNRGTIVEKLTETERALDQRIDTFSDDLTDLMDSSIRYAQALKRLAG